MSLDERLDRYARLAVEVGANVGEGQVLWLSALAEHAPLARAIARCAYERGARYVDVDYSDQHVRRARIQHAPEDTLDWTPPWVLEKMAYVAGEQGALIQIVGDPEPELLADLDGTRVGKTRMRQLAERYVEVLNQRLLNWSIVAYPNEGWAQTVFGEPDVERLWDAVGSAVRLDEPDPVDAWRSHIEKLVERAKVLNDRGFDSLRFRGPGTDLTVGLISGAQWVTALEETVDRTPVRGKHADRGSLHEPGPAAHRGNRPLDEAARTRRHGGARPRGPFRGRPRGRGQRDVGRGRGA